MRINFTSRQAFAIALREAGIRTEDAALLSIRNEDGMYHFKLLTAEMVYEFYVGAQDGFVYGINAEPIMEETCDLAHEGILEASAIAA